MFRRLDQLSTADISWGSRGYNETAGYAYSLARVIRDGELTYGYDFNSNCETITYPGGVTATYTYDFADRQAGLTVDPGSGDRTVVAEAEYLRPARWRGSTSGTA